MAKHSMYDETPKMEHDEEGGVKVKKPEKKSDTGEHDTAPEDDVKEMLKQHEEMKKMHDKHQADSLERIKKHVAKKGATAGSDDVGAPIKDIEKGAK